MLKLVEHKQFWCSEKLYFYGRNNLVVCFLCCTVDKGLLLFMFALRYMHMYNPFTL